jgi:tetratricopeptide (TPR) repeat protein
LPRLLSRVALCIAVVAPALHVVAPTPEAFAQTAAVKRARELFKKSDESYRAGRFQEAIDLLAEAYALDPKPVLLYNQARAYEGLGDTRRAIDAYRRYLDADPSANDRGALEQRIATLERQVQEREVLERQRDAAARSKKEEPPPSPAPQAERPPSAVPWIVAGVGLASVGGGVVLGVLASGKHDDAVEEPRAEPALELQGQAEDFALVANVMLIAGGVVAAGGTIWGIVDAAGSSSSGDVRVGVAPHGIAITGSF